MIEVSLLIKLDASAASGWADLWLLTSIRTLRLPKRPDPLFQFPHPFLNRFDPRLHFRQELGGPGSVELLGSD
jgi:hypothetical protein